MRKVAILFIILIMGLLVACSSTSPASDSIMPESLPDLAPSELEYREDSYTIRVTGSVVIYDEEEHDRRSEGREEEYKLLLRQVLDMSQAEYDQYNTPEGRAKYWEEHDKKYPAYWDDLYRRSPNVRFSGNYILITSDGSTSRSVDGRTPAEYTVKGIIVSCVFQKTGEKGSLKVEILKGGTVVNSSSTTAAYGIVSVATP
ncbi:unnamed protein product [marine sediment metagenome]|uniref:Uncharacterized protein n=1 Tax=marine sediment metagenome TaxID=412755 RepID=X1JET4_9ZZZZ